MACGFKDAGNGLFAETDFATRRVITKFEGEHLYDEYAAAACEDQTYILHMSTDLNNVLGLHFYINGLKDVRHGHGGAQFANHHCGGGNNAEFCLHSEGANMWPHIRATKDIKVTQQLTLTLT